MCDFDLFPGLGRDAEIQYLEGESVVLYKHVCQWMTGANYARMVWSSA